MEITRTVNNINQLSTAQADITSVQNAKGVAGGYCPLDSNALVPAVNLPPIDIVASSSNVAVGGTSFGTNGTGVSSTAVGYKALANSNSASYNTAVGAGTLGICTSGHSNVAIGDTAASSITMQNYNTAIGSSALRSCTGDNNTAVGYSAGSTIQIGSNNTLVGYLANVTNAVFSGSIALGANAQANWSNQMMIAGNITAINAAGLAASADGNGTILAYESGNLLPSGGTNNTVAKLDTALTTLQNPLIMTWLSATGVTITLVTGTISPIAIWDTAYIGNTANMASKTTWTCPKTGLWELGVNLGWSCNTEYVGVQFHYLTLNAGDTVYWGVLPVASYTSGSTTTSIGGDSTETSWHSKYLGAGYTAA